MINTPSISIIMPVYNPNVDYLIQAINSVFSQTLKNIELIIVDDGSSFDYNKKIDTFLKDPRAKFIKLEKNVGPGIARNEGIKAASGQYLAFLDSDDYYYSNEVLEKLYNIAIETSQNVVGGIPYAEENGSLSPIYWSFYKYKNLFKNQIANIKDYQICYGYWSFIYKKDFIISNKIFFKNLRRFQDPPWFLAVLNKSKVYYAADFPYYVHREKSIQEFKWTDVLLRDYFKGLSEVVEMSVKMRFNYLHTYLYRKLFFNEYLLVKKVKDILNIDFSTEFDRLLELFDFNIINNIDSQLPILHTINEFDAINLEEYTHLDY